MTPEENLKFTRIVRKLLKKKDFDPNQSAEENLFDVMDIAHRAFNELNHIHEPKQK
ncbi:MAG: hypothetical protein IJ575_09905 [Selenomonadaceae bacterium]|nr:hypothetical protein [Selenomonadaceae bacterium]